MNRVFFFTTGRLDRSVHDTSGSSMMVSTIPSFGCLGFSGVFKKPGEDDINNPIVRSSTSGG